MADREGKSEVGAKKEQGVIQTFNEIFDESLKIHKNWIGNEPIEYPRYRALKETLASPVFTEESMSNAQIKELVSFLLTSRKHAKAFREWARVMEEDWVFWDLPQNIHRICALGRNELLRRQKG